MGNLIKKKKSLSAENPLLVYAQYAHSTPRVPHTKMVLSTCHVPSSVSLLFLLPEKNSGCSSMLGSTVSHSLRKSSQPLRQSKFPHANVTFIILPGDRKSRVEKTAPRLWRLTRSVISGQLLPPLGPAA